MREKTMPSIMRKILDEVYNQAWTIAGTILVLITLSGKIQTWGIWIGTITLIIHLVGAIIKRVTDDEES